MTPIMEPSPVSPIGHSCMAMTQPCGLCGTQTSTCAGGIESPWSACTGEGVCQAGATQTCGTGGTQTCGATCQWGGCGCPSGSIACGPPGTCVSADDLHTCGTCADDCTALPHVSGPTACAAGTCSFAASSCAQGFADCDGDPSNGCEADVTEAAQCGGCSTAAKSTACSGAAPAVLPLGDDVRVRVRLPFELADAVWHDLRQHDQRREQLRGLRQGLQRRARDRQVQRRRLRRRVVQRRVRGL